ncbi:uncharacterized protein LOC125306012 isoform X2 [Alosa alosa]|uniref:uncharacterized protein LOC125306012 isoform X2 n=1 Tax=Alosa alosa TaxID=278164 RepID=UPI00201518CB|nr:uncharacterized protein LOC125306012 isoform X2 [Alosa alosa]
MDKDKDKEEALARLKTRLMFTIKRRKEVINNSILERRTAIHKQIRHRRYLYHKYERMQMMAPLSLSHVSSSHSPCSELSNNSSNADWWERVVLAEFGPQEWLQRFHVSKDTFYLLCNTLKPQFPQTSLLTSSSKLTLPLEKRVAVALIRLATNMDYSLLAELFGESISTLSQCVREVCDAIIMLLKPLYMHHPGVQELAENARAFHMKWGFPHCVGVIDTLHIPVRSPPAHARDCWSRTTRAGGHAVVMQVGLGIGSRHRVWSTRRAASGTCAWASPGEPRTPPSCRARSCGSWRATGVSPRSHPCCSWASPWATCCWATRATRCTTGWSRITLWPRRLSSSRPRSSTTTRAWTAAGPWWSTPSGGCGRAGSARTGAARRTWSWCP